MRWLAVLLLAVGCGGPPPKAPAIATTISGSKSGDTITLRGRISEEQRGEHLLTGVAGKAEGYFDLSAKEQIVVYWATPPNCAKDVVVTGKVIEQHGESRTKSGERYSELQVDVDSARCEGD